MSLWMQQPYGDIVPVTVMGKIFGGICSLSGVLVIALPVPVIVSNFARIYQQSQQADKKISQQASKAARFKIIAREQKSTFLMGKRLAELHMNAMDAENDFCAQGSRSDNGDDGIKIINESNDTATMEDKMYTDHMNVVRNRWNPAPKSDVDDEADVKGELIRTSHEEVSNPLPITERVTMSPPQLQHYHLLACLERLISYKQLQNVTYQNSIISVDIDLLSAPQNSLEKQLQMFFELRRKEVIISKFCELNLPSLSKNDFLTAVAIKQSSTYSEHCL
ncbi:hypothetical protein ACTXT7_003903 [Hymenolepis weldensis]